MPVRWLTYGARARTWSLGLKRLRIFRNSKHATCKRSWLTFIRSLTVFKTQFVSYNIEHFNHCQYCLDFDQASLSLDYSPLLPLDSIFCPTSTFILGWEKYLPLLRHLCWNISQFMLIVFLLHTLSLKAKNLFVVNIIHEQCLLQWRYSDIYCEITMHLV